ncbi:MAG TPA: antitoxin MazE family protein [Allosphingosinicella sp.]|nr:antitoxin MazE family protein [Allosphingosinicella sp.]
MASGARPSRDKVRNHRARMRAQGMKSVHFWVPDVASPAFKAEAARQARLVACATHEADDQAFLDSIFDD